MQTKINTLKNELNYEVGNGFIAFVAEDYVIDDFEDIYDISGLKQLGDLQNDKVEALIDLLEKDDVDYYGNGKVYDAIYFKL